MKKAALVTGGARRIGGEIVRRLAREGYAVAVHFRSSREQAQALRQECMDAGALQVEILNGDLSYARVRETLIARATQLVGPISLLVNSASMFEYDDVNGFDGARFEQHLQTNFIAPVELTMALYRASMESVGGSAPHSISLLDQKIFNLNPDYMTYTLAKLANHASIRYLAQCCAPAIRVNAIAPGVTLLSGEMDESAFQRAHKLAALGRSSSVQDIADAVVMLDAATSITGQTIAVDGGQHLVPRGRDVAFEEAL